MTKNKFPALIVEKFDYLLPEQRTKKAQDILDGINDSKTATEFFEAFENDHYHCIAFTPQTLEELFDAFRCDWCDCHSTMIKENFVIHLN